MMSGFFSARTESLVWSIALLCRYASANFSQYRTTLTLPAGSMRVPRAARSPSAFPAPQAARSGRAQRLAQVLLIDIEPALDSTPRCRRDDTAPRTSAPLPRCCCGHRRGGGRGSLFTSCPDGCSPPARPLARPRPRRGRAGSEPSPDCGCGRPRRCPRPGSWVGGATTGSRRSERLGAAGTPRTRSLVCRRRVGRSASAGV